MHTVSRMRRVLLLALAALVACSSDPAPTRACTPGAQVACACPGGAASVQVCAADGSGLGACACSVADAGADAAPDARPEAAVDVQLQDVAPEASADVAVDQGPETPPPRDAAAEAGLDAVEFDAVADAHDAAPGVDTGSELGASTDAADATPACPPTLTLCAGTCTSIILDRANCGACGRTCADDQVCSTGTCQDCVGGTTRCGSRCVDPATDNANCGACGTRCAAVHRSAVCRAGACVIASCDPGLGDCDHDPSNGCETSLAANRDHCGACGNRCPGDLLCMADVCQCTTGTMCGTRCLDLTRDPSNCGACGNVCAATEYCASGRCVACGLSSEGTQRFQCSNTCVDTSFDDHNCGGCNILCSSGLFCSRGRCCRTPC